MLVRIPKVERNARASYNHHPYRHSLAPTYNMHNISSFLVAATAAVTATRTAAKHHHFGAMRKCSPPPLPPQEGGSGSVGNIAVPLLEDMYHTQAHSLKLKFTYERRICTYTCTI